MLSELDLHVTNRCTTNCDYCCFSSNRNLLYELNTQELFSVIEQAVRLGCSHIHITGGEPLLRKDLIDIISYANGLGMSLRLQTNGALLTAERARLLYQAGVKSIMISLDSNDPILHDSVRGEGTWKKAVEAIRIAQTEGMDVRVNSVISKKNKDKIYDTICFVEKMGVENYSAFYFSPIGCGRKHWDMWLPPAEYLHYWKDLNRAIRENARLCHMNIIIEKGYSSWEEASSIHIQGFTGCGGGCLNSYVHKDYLIVRCDGNVYPCIMAIDSEPLGNVRLQPLSWIYSQSPQWGKLLPTGDKECSHCEHHKLCGEGCRFYPGGAEGRDARCQKNAIVPLCPIMKYNFRNGELGGSSEDVME